MKHIKIYENFVNEKMGVPAGLTTIADHMLDRVFTQFKDKVEVSIYQGLGDFKFTIEFDTRGTEYPTGTINVTVKFNDIDGDLIVDGAMNPTSLKIDTKSEFEIDMKIEIYANIGYVLDNTDKLKSEMRGTIYHEMTHILEAYLRKSTNGIELQNLDTFLYNMVGRSMPTGLPVSINQFFHLVYLAQAPEVSARIPQMYAFIKDIPDPHKRLDIIKKSGMWEDSEHMISYDPIDYINRSKGNKTEAAWNKFKTQMGEFTERVITQINDPSGNFIKLYRSDNAEDRKRAKDIIPKKRNRMAIKNSTTDIEKMMHEWKGIINRAGKKLQYKLTKLTTAD